MGNNMVLASNQEVTYESGASRFAKSVCCAFCVAPLVILIALVAVGWNEQRAVCDDRIIAKGKDIVQEIGCTDVTSGNGALVMMNCQLISGLQELILHGQGDFGENKINAIGLEARTEMRQCVETQSSTTRRTTGGGKETITTYTYSIKWTDHWVDSSRFYDENEKRRTCGNAENPRWTAEIPQGTIRATKIQVGEFITTESSFINAVPLDRPVQFPITPLGWTRDSTTYSRDFLSDPRGIGQVRTRFFTNDWSRNDVTLLGENQQGAVQLWTGPDSWLCSGFQLGTLRMGTMSKDKLFAQLADEANALTWVLRIGCFLAIWLGFAFCFMPLSSLADCVPCCGECLSEIVQVVACMVACLPATALCMLVAGAMWVVMRPVAGIGLLLVSFGAIALGIAAAVMANRKRSARAMSGGEGAGLRQQLAQPQWQQTAYPQPQWQQQPQPQWQQQPQPQWMQQPQPQWQQQPQPSQWQQQPQPSQWR